VVVASNPFLVFVFFWIYGLSLFGFILVVQALFQNPKTASVCGTLFYFSLGFVDQLVKENTIPESTKNMLSIFSNVAVSRGSANLACFESARIGLTFGNFFQPYNNYRFSVCFVMMVLSGLLFSLVGLYLDNIIPGAYGQCRPWYFPLKLSFWKSILIS